MSTATPDLLKVEGLTTQIRVGGTWYDAVREVSFAVSGGETLALVGESGCGKSLTALSVMGLLAPKIGRVAAGSIVVDGTDMRAASEAQREAMRGDRLAMIFQEPMTSLNPVLTIGFQIAEALRRHRGLSKAAAREKAIALLERVRVPSAAERIDAYPHQFSGGMRQRVMIAMALACSPRVLIADEPTTALDVTIQAQVLALLADIQRREGLAVLLITHNLGVVASVADRVMVMYGGDVVESAPVRAFFAQPTHPYAEGLLQAMPRVDRVQALAAIPGTVPTLPEMPEGCRFQGRCPLREERCRERPPLVPLKGASDHAVRCWVRAA
ncbi:ABC transporter ATP-binding protein [Methylobacterium frigidaeris]|uniref:Dipeptide transport ATP-binding protein DppD n=1 Tax=Methylobacterium frigidaeris TaxID=2038277 RepID=A0AA37HI53_9HYPH|nr:ABC transporter ATP-binding protein [Methylobacterium frigidaeris]PIK69706.1 dipeptide/oligopeptide/nickel ABC transporter ATP-binding protein [Methylobacterium frigidaeris]GJD66193.1 Dipeptide transport ATP-binding protein DppD [Methylobacterium frigidaeris]